MDAQNAARLARWHQIIKTRNASMLNDLLADDIIFHPPALWTPERGKSAALLVLSTVLTIFEDFEYHRQSIEQNTCFLEFGARIGSLRLKGVEIIEWNEQGKIREFEVMIRPMAALTILAQEMSRHLGGGL